MKVNIEITDRFKEVIRFAGNNFLAKKIERLINFGEGELNKKDYPRFIDISDTTISYISNKNYIKLIENKNNIDGFNCRGRVNVKYGSFIRKLFDLKNDDFSDCDIEKFVNIVKSYYEKGEFIVVEGDDILKYYKEDMISDVNINSTLNSSCMRHDKCMKYLSIYKDNIENIKMLVYLDDVGLVKGRALLWDVGNINIMDRVYSESDQVNLHMFQWCRENGYIWKHKQTWKSTYEFTDGENIFKSAIKIKLKKWDYKLEYDRNGHRYENGKEGYPYMDTFRWINIVTGDMYNYKPLDVNIKHLRTMCSIDGDLYTGNYLQEDEINNEYSLESDIVYLKYINLNTDKKYCVFSKTSNTFILKKDSVLIKGVDYIFNQIYNSLNDEASIMYAISERELQLERERKERISKSLSEIKDMIELFENSGDVLSYNNYDVIDYDYEYDYKFTQMMGLTQNQIRPIYQSTIDTLIYQPTGRIYR